MRPVSQPAAAQFAVGEVPASEKYELSCASTVLAAPVNATATVIWGSVALDETVVVTTYERWSGASEPETVCVYGVLPEYGCGKPEYVGVTGQAAG
jgi:hypothetical protein